MNTNHVKPQNVKVLLALAFDLLVTVFLAAWELSNQVWIEPHSEHLSENSVIARNEHEVAQPACDGLPECAYIKAHQNGQLAVISVSGPVATPACDQLPEGDYTRMYSQGTPYRIR